MFRVRATSFFTGFAVASAIAMFQLQRDVWGSHHILADEVLETSKHLSYSVVIDNDELICDSRQLYDWLGSRNDASALGLFHFNGDSREVEEYYSQLEKRIQQLERTASGGTTSRPRPVGAEECD